MATQTTIGGTLAIEYNNETETFPVSTALTGTIDSVNGLNKEIVGTNTLFETELQVGDWIYVAAKGECRQIENISNDTKLSLKSAFTGAALSGATPLRVYCPFREASIGVRGTTATINGVKVNNASTTKIGSISSESRKSQLDPFVVVAGATDYVTIIAQ